MSCIFFLDISLYTVRYSPHPPTTFPMSLHIHNDDTTDYINFWNHNYSQTKNCFYPRNRKWSLFLHFDRNVLLVFSEDKQCSWVYHGPQYHQGILQIIICLPLLWLPLYITHFNIYSTSLTHHLRTRKPSFRKCLPPTDISTPVQSNLYITS